MDYRSVIGLEVHIELKTKTKMFCSCLNDPNERHPNLRICPICTAQPGTLPVINEEAVRKVIKTGLALNCQIPEYSKFDRKNYFYPDLPKGYQISQYDAPLCRGGYLEIPSFDDDAAVEKSQNPKFKKIRIRRVHLEEDTGRLIHPEGTNYSLVDFNRAGIPLMELVTEPDLKSAKEAKKFAEELQLILRYLGVSDADMEKGQLRVEVNISLGEKGKLGTKVEIKNLNSLRAVEKGIDYEIERQEKILRSGKKIVQETRGWDNVKGATISQREKEEADDYRYFPEPDLPPLHFSEKGIAKIKAGLPELPRQRRERFSREYQLDEKNIEVFVRNKDLGEYFEKAVSELPPNLLRENLSKLIKLTSNYIITDLQGLLRRAKVSGERRSIAFGEIGGMDFLITPENFAEFITLIFEGKISSKIAKQVLSEMFSSGADPSRLIEEKGLTQITDQAEIEKVIKEVIENNPKAIKDFKAGKETAVQFLIGQVMIMTNSKTNPQMANKILKETINKIKQF